MELIEEDGGNLQREQLSAGGFSVWSKQALPCSQGNSEAGACILHQRVLSKERCDLVLKSYQVILRGGSRWHAAAPAGQALLRGDGGLLGMLGALRMLPRLLLSSVRAAQWPLCPLLVLMVLGNPLLQIEACPWHGSTCCKEGANQTLPHDSNPAVLMA